jgi:hypothetical protein
MAHKRVYATGGHRYGTRMLQAGEPLTLDAPRARLLTAMGWVTDKRPRQARPQLDHDGDGKAGGSPKPTGADLPALRQEYQAKFGKKAFNGWNADTLRAKIAEGPANG